MKKEKRKQKTFISRGKNSSTLVVLPKLNTRISVPLKTKKQKPNLSYYEQKTKNELQAKLKRRAKTRRAKKTKQLNRK